MELATSQVREYQHESRSNFENITMSYLPTLKAGQFNGYFNLEVYRSPSSTDTQWCPCKRRFPDPSTVPRCSMLEYLPTSKLHIYGSDVDKYSSTMEHLGYVPFGKHTKNYGKSPCSMDKTTRIWSIWGTEHDEASNLAPVQAAETVPVPASVAPPEPVKVRGSGAAPRPPLLPWYFQTWRVWPSGWWFGTFLSFHIYIYIGNNHPNWRSYFWEG